MLLCFSKKFELKNKTVDSFDVKIFKCEIINLIMHSVERNLGAGATVAYCP